MLNRQIHSVHPATTTTIVPAIDADSMILADNLRIHPDVLIGNGNGVFGSGIQGTGKTGIMARILEQAARFHIPMVVFDREGDLAPATGLFPKGYIGTFSSCPMARDVVRSRLQVIFDLSTWPNMDMRGSFVANMVNALFAVTDALPVSHRTPCLIGLDEAAMFLPQKRGETFSIEVYKAMHDAFHNISTMGRKRGLTPILFSQKISEVAKTVLSPGTYIILKQVVHTDLKRALEYVEREDIFSYMTERQICQFISSLQPGRAIVKLANGEQRICQFYERESIHTSHTPSVQAALNRYSSASFDANQSFGAYIEDIEEESPSRTGRSKTDLTTSKHTTGAERVYSLLRQDPTLRPCDLARRAKVDPALAGRERKKFFAEQEQP